MNRTLAILSILFCLLAPLVHAETHITEKDEMRKLYHDLDMRRLDAKRKFKIHLETGLALDSCIGAKASLEVCRTITSELDEKLSKRIYEEKMLIEQKRTNEILEEKEKNNAAAVENLTNITIYESEQKHHRRYPYGDDYLRPPHPRPTTTPGYKPPKGFKPQNRFQAKEVN